MPNVTRRVKQTREPTDLRSLLSQLGTESIRLKSNIKRERQNRIGLVIHAWVLVFGTYLAGEEGQTPDDPAEQGDTYILLDTAEAIDAYRTARIMEAAESFVAPALTSEHEALLAREWGKLCIGILVGSFTVSMSEESSNMDELGAGIQVLVDEHPVNDGDPGEELPFDRNGTSIVSEDGLDPVGRGGAEASLRRSHLQRGFLSKVHVKPHLVIGNVPAWHRCPTL